MKNKLIIAAFLLSLPVFLNFIILFIIYINNPESNLESTGYLVGSLTSAGLSILWLIQLRKGIRTNVLNFMKMIMQSYAIKVVFLLGLLIGGHILFSFDRIYFVLAFFLGTFISMVIEVWYYLTVRKTNE